MSVLVPEVEVFNNVYDKAVNYTFHKVCDINYCSTLGHMTEVQIKNTIKTLCDLNVESYEKAYKQNPGEVKFSDTIKFDRSGSIIDTYQMLKYLECIYYNIELDTIDRELNRMESDSMKTLRKSIDEIKSAIIGEIPEYKDAKWCN